MATDVISLYLADLEAADQQAALTTPPVRMRRVLHPWIGPSPAQSEKISLAQARIDMNQAMLEYVQHGKVGTQLLVKAPAGTGKTRAGVDLAEALASAGKRILWLAPRRNMFQEMLKEAKHPEWWYQWEPRQSEDMAAGKIETCQHAEPISAWMDRGWPAISFCKKICGWDFIKDGCRYHAQKQTRHPIIVGTHNHLVLGHPMQDHFDLIIGDEYPIDEFMHDWEIPGIAIAPRGIDDPELALLLADMARLASSGGAFSGPELIKLLGGADRIIRVTAALQHLSGSPPLYKPDDANKAPYNHLAALVSLLDREARLTAQDLDYPHRILLIGGKLHLLLRRSINDALAQTKTIWLDATANIELYERITGWSCVVFDPKIERQGYVRQIWDTTNNKTSIIADGEKTTKLDRIQSQITHAIEHYDYQKPAVISYLALKEEFGMASKFLHFHGNRGTNEFSTEQFQADALFIVGTPNISPYAMERMGRMLFWERDRPFQLNVTEQLVPYAGKALSIPVSGFWDDFDMQLLHDQLRDAELLQAAYRGRPLTQPIDIWLMTSHPIADLSPDCLLSIRDLFKAPPGIDPVVWHEVVMLANAAHAANIGISPHDLETIMECSHTAANRYIDALILAFPDRWERGIMPRQSGKRGRARKAAKPVS